VTAGTSISSNQWTPWRWVALTTWTSSSDPCPSRRCVAPCDAKRFLGDAKRFLGDASQIHLRLDACVAAAAVATAAAAAAAAAVPGDDDYDAGRRANPKRQKIVAVKPYACAREFAVDVVQVGEPIPTPQHTCPLVAHGV
jgi:hypothetical protein